MPMMISRVIYFLVLLICWIIFEAVVIKPVRFPLMLSHIVVPKSSFFTLKSLFFRISREGLLRSLSRFPGCMIKM